MSHPACDEALRRRALEVLGALAEPLARDALESGDVLVEPNVRTWEGSTGTMHGHRIVVAVEESLHARLVANLAAVAALEAALAAAMAERRGHATADVRLEVGAVPATAPYRGRA